MELPVIQPGRPRATAPPIFEKIGIVGLGLIGGSIALAARRALAEVAGDRRRHEGRARDGDAAARDRRRRRRPDRAGRGRRGDSRGAGPAEHRAPRRARRCGAHAGGRDRHRQHEARDRRGGASAAAALHVCRRPSARRRGDEAVSSMRAPICSSGRPWLFTPTGDGAGAARREAVGVRARARRRAAT